MALLLAVDPGVIRAGAAFFCNGTLVDAWLTTAVCWKWTARDIIATLWERHYSIYGDDGRRVWPDLKIVVEIPQIYVGARQKGRQKDLVDVALMAGMLLGAAASMTDDFVVVRPAEWKGQLPKEVIEARVKERLSCTEQLRIRLPKKKSLQSNVWDAIGIGMWAEKKL